MIRAPIALFVFRRPDHTRRVLEALKRNPEARQTDLHLFSDGPRDARDADAVAEVRRLCRSVEGFANVRLVERDANWGLAKSVIAGVSEICEKYGHIIVLEDDLVVSPHFLAYMNEGLRRYAESELVMQISGYMPPVAWEGADDAAFLPMTTSWGWATWQRAWARFDPAMSGYTRLKKDPQLCRAFDLDGAFPYFRMLKAQKQGQVDSWAIRWYLSVFLKSGLVLFPRQSQVENIGFDGTGTHCRETEIEPHAGKDFFVSRYPIEVGIDQALFRAVVCHQFNTAAAAHTSIVGRLLEGVANVFNR